VRKIESAQRVNAGILFEQERVAGVEGTKPQTSVEFEAPKSETAAPAPDKPKDESFVKPIRDLPERYREARAG